jgi:hypothetical protein
VLVLGPLALVGTVLVAPTASADPRPTVRSARGYVALGDSYAAGEGLPPFEAGTEGAEGCHRSVHRSYPALLGSSGQRDFRPAASVACSGAIAADLLASRPNSTRPPQIAALDSRTRTVTVTIGGNDAGFGPVFADCVYSPDPALQAALPRRGPGCADRNDLVVSARIAALSGAPGAPTIPGVVPLPVALAQIDAVAPRATVYLTGYPSVFGTRIVDDRGCRVSKTAPLYVAGADAAWIRRKASDLNTTIRSAAAQARAAGADVHYVDAARAFRGRNLCDKKASWLNGVVLESATPPTLSSATFHPTARGQRAYAKAVLRTAARNQWWAPSSPESGR